MKRLHFLTMCLVLAGIAGSGCERAARIDKLREGLRPETKAQHDERMAWWRKARFGMFIHWGVYSVPAGTYKDKRIGGIGEWIMLNGEIPVAEYKEYAKRFNPVKYDPDAWVRLAKAAGMKYIVITSKHHDGFALFDSKATDWDIVDATPYGKDLLKPLAEACKKHGLKLGFYHSQAQDWCHPGGAAWGDKQWDPAQAGDMDEYIRKIAAPQVREILTNYGDIAVLWWDTPWGMNKERADMLLPLLELQPGIITNNRLCEGVYRGDFTTPEQHIPATGLDYDWETCMTMNETWGYKSYDDEWKSAETLIHNLIDIASKGGNYLLNVGPTSEGLIPEPSVKRLVEMGKWMKINGEAIYGTSASPFDRPGWGRFTAKSGIVYAHLFNWPQDLMHIGELGSESLGGIKVTDVTMLGSGEKLHWTQGKDSLVVSVPSQKPSKYANVLKIRLEGRGFGNLQLGCDGDALTASVTCMNYNRSRWSETFSLYIDGEVAMSQKVTLKPRTKGTVTLRYELPEAGIYKVAIGSGSRATRAKSIVFPGIRLRGGWRFRTGDEQDWKRPDFDDSGWEVVRLPKSWEVHSGYTKDRVFGWYRTAVNIPVEWRGHDLMLPLGKIDDVDETFFNGKRIGGMGHLFPEYETAWNISRRYTVPQEFINYGQENVIAIRVFDDRGGGGLYDGPLGPIEITQ